MMNNQKKMAIKQSIFIGILFITLILFGANYFVRPFEKHFDVKDEIVGEVEQPVEPIPLTKEDFLEQLSTEEKIAQMIAYPLIINEREEEGHDFIKEFFSAVVDADEPEESVGTDSAKNKVLEEMEIEKLRLDKLSPGFITIFGSEIASDSAKQKVIEVKNLYRDNLLSPRFAVDHEGGSVQRLSGAGYTILPSWNEMCKLEGNEMTSILEKSAKELRTSGIDIVLAPVLDVGNNSILKDRICSDSYATVADRSIEYSTIFNSFGILPVLKHFPGIGNIKKDLHTDFDFIEVLDNDVKLYKYVIEESPEVAVMVSHAGISNQDFQIPCSLSENCVSELKNAYPQILVFSDALEMESVRFDKNNVSEPKDLVRVSKEAVLAGNEVLIYGQSVTSSDMKNIIFNLSREYEKNSQFENLVDQAVLKIVSYKHTER